MLARREDNLLALEVTEGGPANAGAASTEDNHGALANREERNQRRRGTKPSSARSLHKKPTDPRTRRGEPLNGRVCLTCEAAKVGKEGGTPHPAARAHSLQ